jgi:hypothetical protein
MILEDVKTGQYAQLHEVLAMADLTCSDHNHIIAIARKRAVTFMPIEKAPVEYKYKERYRAVTIWDANVDDIGG